MKCRHCKKELNVTFVDLGSAPPSNAYLTKEMLLSSEKWYPLKVLVCEECWLVQTQDFNEPLELFDAEYAYFSGFSTSWLQHCKEFVSLMVERFSLNESSHVVEIAANDGYLLQYVVERNISCTGVEPTASTAAAAREKGIEIVEEFFGKKMAEEFIKKYKQADLTVANNVLAHVPDINDFVSGFPILLKPQGIASFEFPHLLKLIKFRQFDTIYHEHFSYLSLSAVNHIFKVNGLMVFDVEELPTHGGSIRVLAQRSDTGKEKVRKSVYDLLEVESTAGLTSMPYYSGFQSKVEKIKDDFLEFLLKAKSEGKIVVGYGAAAKGNTLFNFAGIRQDLISFVVDKNPAKKDKYLPGCRIPIVDEKKIEESKPDYVVVIPWNIKEEIINQLKYIRDWGGRFIIAIPELKIL